MSDTKRNPDELAPEYDISESRPNPYSLDEDPKVEAAWRAEVRRRLEACRAGDEATIDRDEVIREALRRYGA